MSFKLLLSFFKKSGSADQIRKNRNFEINKKDMLEFSIINLLFIKLFTLFTVFQRKFSAIYELNSNSEMKQG